MEAKVDIAAAFGGQEQLSKSAIAQYLTQQQPEISTSMLNWRIHELLRRGALVSVGRGSYGLPRKVAYRPVLNARMVEIANILKKGFPYLGFSIFHTEQLSRMMQHIPGRHFILIEVERVGMESVFNHLQDLGIRNYLQPDVKTMVRYVSFETESLIVQPLLSEAPLLHVDGIETPTLEKLLVDLACEKSVFHSFQGAEMHYIYERAFEVYDVRKDRLLRYADRRNRKDLIMSLLRH